MISESAGTGGSSHVRSGPCEYWLCSSRWCRAFLASSRRRLRPLALWRLTDLAAQRVAIADQVAAAKYGTPSPIDDPAREQQIYDSVSAQAPALGLDPADAVRFFRAQIEANKLVQRGWYARWDAHPSEVPTTRPDLARSAR